jgi:ribonuclease BN (tRNA processing enzyme)
MKVVLLGTGGGPRASRTRFPTSQAILADGQMVVIDCGNGVAKQLAAARLSARDMSHLLVTHHHVDHSADLGYLPMAAWIEGRTDSIKVLGPPPTVGALEALLAGYAEDLEKRTRSTGRPPFRPMLQVRDITAPGPVLEEAGLEISCAFVDHPPFEIALGYRVDFGGKSVVVSGDTAPSPALVELARGADVLIHEVVHPEAFAEVTKNTNASTIREHMSRNHTMLDDVGQIAAEAGVGRLVLSHMIPHDGLTTEDWIGPIRPHFDGEVIVGEDLMEIDV